MYDHSYFIKAWLSAVTLPFWLASATLHDATRVTGEITRTLGDGAMRSAATMFGPGDRL